LCLSGGALEIFLQPRLPPATVRVVGGTPIALALADLGAQLGYAVERDDPERSAPLAGDAAVIVASHGREEERVLAEARRAETPCGGRVASGRRGEAVRESRDVPAELRERLHTPAGLEIGADTPQEIALSILAEVVALRAPGAEGAALRPVAPSLSVAGGVPAEPPPQSAAAPSAEAEAAAGTVAVALDPVCGMEVAVSPASIQLEHGGERYFFCSEGCRDSFAAKETHDAAAG